MPKNTEKPTVISDFDGTVTATEKIADKYFDIYIRAMAKKFNLEQSSLNAAMRNFISDIANRPEAYGWEVNGHIVAAASSDPYVLATTASRLVINQLIMEKRLPEIDASLIENFLHEMYAACYPEVKVPFREDAKEYLQTLNDFAHLIVVTNSDPAAVLHKMKHLLGKKVSNFRVVGNARKYLVDPMWTDVKPTTHVQGLQRPVHLRRKQYGTIISTLNQEFGQPIEAVVGDNYELDLSLPENLTITTMLILNAMTPAWEQTHYQNHDNGFATASLAEVSDRLLSSS